MHNYVFTLTVNIKYNVHFVHLLYLSKKCTIIYLLLLSIYSTLCSLYIYYICPTKAQLSVNSVNIQYNVKFVHLLYLSKKCTIIYLL